MTSRPVNVALPMFVRVFLRLLLRLLVLSVAPLMPAASSAASLFDGQHPERDWQGWASADYPSAWVARDGALTLDGPVEDGWFRDGGYLISRARFADFDLRFEFRTSPGANSGVMVRVQPKAPGEDWPWHSGTEYQILDAAAPSEHGAFADRTADLYDLVAARGASMAPAGRWNRGRIVACGRHLEHWLNGRRVVSVDLDSPAMRALIARSKFADFAGFAQAPEGHIALQDHGLAVWFRRLEIDRLDAACHASKAEPP